MIRCVIFDFDSALEDSNSIKCEAFLSTTVRDGEELPMEEILETQPDDRYAIFSKFAAACNNISIDS